MYCHGIPTTTWSCGVERRRKAEQDDGGEHNPRRISSLPLPSRIVGGGGRGGGRVGEGSVFVHYAIDRCGGINHTSRCIYFMVRSFVLVTFEETRNVIL